MYVEIDCLFLNFESKAMDRTIDKSSASKSQVRIAGYLKSQQR